MADSFGDAMTREIKFRGWHTKLRRMIPPEEMVRDQLALLPDGRFANIHSTHTSLSEIYLANKFIPLQFTGLLDKNGVEIYEGDILRLFYPRNHGFGGIHKEELIVEISFQGAAFWFTGGGVTDCNWHFYNAEDREVVGNVHENPELLTK